MAVKARHILLALTLLWATHAALAVDPVTLRSHSGQFLVRGLPLIRRAPVADTNSEVAYVRLDPTLLAVSCERVKSALLEELGMKDQWRGKIYVSLHPVQEDGEPIVITTLRYSDGWAYRLEIPEQVDGPRLVKSLVQVLLLELANRNGRARQAELPLWLTEGLTAHLQATALANFTLEPDTRIIRKLRNPDPLALARERLRGHAPLTFDELNWPPEEALTEDKIEVYQSYAQIFVHELLHLRQGRSCLQNMLALLPENLNWQIAFLRAFHPYFQRLIDVDKWWSLHVVHLIGQGQSSLWVRAETCKQLDDILTTPVQVRLSPGELPLSAEVKLQSVLAEWDFSRQRLLLLQKLNLLSALRRRASEDSVGLVEDYRLTLEIYLQRRGQLGGSAKKKELSPTARLVVNDTVRRLDNLDTQRDILRQQTNSPPAQLTISK